MMLIVMRLANMHRVHPRQDNSRVCAKCGHQVGIYPSGQAALRHQPDLTITCDVCYKAGVADVPFVLPGAVQESEESVDAERPGHKH